MPRPSDTTGKTTLQVKLAPSCRLTFPSEPTSLAPRASQSYRGDPRSSLLSYAARSWQRWRGQAAKSRPGRPGRPGRAERALPDLPFAPRDLVHHALDELDGREPPAVHAPRVDADLVGKVDEDLAPRGVAEHDRVREIVRFMDELLADPENVLRDLLLQRAPGTDARVHEEEAIGDEPGQQPLEELEVRRWEALRRGRAGEAEGHPVARERRRGAVHHPRPAPLSAAPEVGEAHVFVVAAQEDGGEPLAGTEREQEVDDGAHRGPAVEVVADEGERVAARERERTDERLQLLGAAVDVPHHVEPSRHAQRRPSSRSSVARSSRMRWAAV